LEIEHTFCNVSQSTSILNPPKGLFKIGKLFEPINPRGLSVEILSNSLTITVKTNLFIKGYGQAGYLQMWNSIHWYIINMQ